jgi:enoyl-[acyl-carrier-protein] reductase (NADH)
VYHIKKIIFQLHSTKEEELNNVLSTAGHKHTWQKINVVLHGILLMKKSSVKGCG